MSKKKSLVVENEKLLKEISSVIFDDMLQVERHAGTALCTGSDEDVQFWKGQYIALDRTRKVVETRYLRIFAEKEGW